jgi:hypothetical protein
VLPRLLAHLQHAASARPTHALLCDTADALRAGAAGAPGLLLLLRRHNTGDPLVSAWELVAPGLPPLSIVLRGAEAHIEGVRTDESLDLPAAGTALARLLTMRHRRLTFPVQASKSRPAGSRFGWPTRFANMC